MQHRITIFANGRYTRTVGASASVFAIMSKYEKTSSISLKLNTASHSSTEPVNLDVAMVELGALHIHFSGVCCALREIAMDRL